MRANTRTSNVAPMKEPQHPAQRVSASPNVPACLDIIRWRPFGSDMCFYVLVKLVEESLSPSSSCSSSRPSSPPPPRRREAGLGNAQDTEDEVRVDLVAHPVNDIEAVEQRPHADPTACVHRDARSLACVPPDSVFRHARMSGPESKEIGNGPDHALACGDEFGVGTVPTYPGR